MSETDFSGAIAAANGASAPPKVFAEFYAEPVLMDFRSKAEGRPIYEEREFVKIIIPGARGSTVNEPVNDEHKARWPEAYKAFKEGREAPREGTPLTEWPRINRAQAEELAYFHIKTVEELAGVNDIQLQKLGMGSRELRTSAQKFLEVARTGTGPLEKLLSDNQRFAIENDRLTRELTAANAEINALKERLHASAAA